jgi:hypothetical protein
VPCVYTHPEAPAPGKSEIESTQSTVFSLNTSCLEAVLKIFRRRTCGHRGSVGIKQSQLSQGAQLSGNIFRRIAFFLKKKKKPTKANNRTTKSTDRKPPGKASLPSTCVLLWLLWRKKTTNLTKWSVEGIGLGAQVRGSAITEINTASPLDLMLNAFRTTRFPTTPIAITKISPLLTVHCKKKCRDSLRHVSSWQPLASTKI